MWEFLGAVIEHAGFVAALYVMTLIGGSFAFRALWKRLESLSDEKTKALIGIEKVRSEETAKRSAMREAFEKERSEMRDTSNKELLMVAEQRRAEADKFGARIDNVRDKHVSQMVSLVEKSTRHVERTDQSVDKLATAVDTLIRGGTR